MYIGLHVRTKKIFCICAFLSIILYLYISRNSTDNLQSENTVSLKMLLAGAITAAKFGGFQVSSVYEQSKLNIEIKGKTKEGVNDLVTSADYRSHCVMYDFLSQTFPGVTIISEEASKDCDKLTRPDINIDKSDHNLDLDMYVDPKDVTIWLDPLDATKEFTENLLQFVTTMVCVVVKGKPVIGVIYKPFESRKNSSLFWIWANRGSSANLQNLPKPEPEKPPILIVSMSHAGDVKNASRTAFGDNVQIIPAAGAGYKFLEVIAGNATAYVHMTAIKKWDICAGTAILSALGGRITPLFHEESINFGHTDSKVLTSGLLATMSNHEWYLDKFSNIQ